MVRCAAIHSRRRGPSPRRQCHRRCTHARGGIIWGIGAHVIKTGVSPVIIDLMQRGYVSALAMNGAGVIHDFEIALAGVTSEDVDEALGPGRFGMAEETGRILNEVIRSAQPGRRGLVRQWRLLVRGKRPWADRSLIGDGASPGIPVTVHVAIGTDIIHMHRTRQGRPSGRPVSGTSAISPRVSPGSQAACYLNCGSAVVLPEVFLKAVALARNQGIALDGLTTVNIDFMRMYRPQTNVVTRPVAGTKGSGISLVGPSRGLDSADCRGRHRERSVTGQAGSSEPADPAVQ